MTDTFKVAIIKPNKNLEDLNNYIELKDTNKEDMMELIVNTIKLDSNLMGNTIVCYEDAKHIYQLCHLNLEDCGMKNNEEEINTIGSTLVLDDTKVYGNAVFICSAISDNYTCTSASIDLETIKLLLDKKNKHYGVLIKTSGEVKDIIFTKDPMENLPQDEVKNYQWMEVPLCKFNLILFVQVQPTPDSINKKATRLCGKHNIHGDCILVSKSTENNFLDVNTNLLDDLLLVAGGSLSDRTLKEDEKLENTKINNLPVVMNRYCVLEKRLKEYKYTCSGCNKDLDKDNHVVCTGCYRMMYHDNICQSDHWNLHKSECLYKIQNINKLLKK